MSGDSERYALGVDVGGSFLKAGLVTASGGVALRERRPVRKNSIEAFYLVLGELVTSMAAKAGEGNLVGVGLGVAGFLNHRTGLVEQSPNLHILDGAAIFKDLAELLPYRVVVDNDANAAAWGEYWAGGGGGADLLILLTLGSGIGGGIIWGGSIWHGAAGYAGEIGHTVITHPTAGPLCNCGMRGCMEAEFSQTAFLRKVRESIAAGRETTLAAIPAGRLNAQHVTDAAAAGDPVAFEIVSTSSRMLGWKIAGLVNALNPDQVVLGGGIIAAADLLMPLIMEGVRENSIPGALGSCTVRPSTLGNDAGLIGSAGLAWREFGGGE